MIGLILVLSNTEQFCYQQYQQGLENMQAAPYSNDTLSESRILFRYVICFQ